MGVYIGARDQAAAQKLWQSLPLNLLPMCDRLHRFLGSVRGSSTQQASSSGGQRDGERSRQFVLGQDNDLARVLQIMKQLAQIIG